MSRGSCFLHWQLLSVSVGVSYDGILLLVQFVLAYWSSHQDKAERQRQAAAPTQASAAAPRHCRAVLQISQGTACAVLLLQKIKDYAVHSQQAEVPWSQIITCATQAAITGVRFACVDHNI